MAPIGALQMSARMAQIGQCVQIRGMPALGKRIAGTEREKQREYHSWNENSGNSFHGFGLSWNECLCAQKCTPKTRGSEPLRAPWPVKHTSREKVSGRSEANLFVQMLNRPIGQPCQLCMWAGCPRHGFCAWVLGSSPFADLCTLPAPCCEGCVI